MCASIRRTGMLTFIKQLQAKKPCDKVCELHHPTVALADRHCTRSPVFNYSTVVA